MRRHEKRFLTNFCDFVLEEQFASLQFMQFELVYGGMELFLLDFPLQRHVAAFEFGEMAMQGHAQLLSVLERQDCDTIPASRKRKCFAASRKLEESCNVSGRFATN